MPKPKPQVKKTITTRTLEMRKTAPAALQHKPASALAEEDAGAGQESMKSGDYSIPRLSILQDMSPQVKKQEAAYIKGAETGNIIDPISERLWDGEKGIRVIPISYRRAHLEWKPDRGGFVKDHGSEDTILAQTEKDDKGANRMKNGNTISISGEYFLFVMEEDGTYQPYLISMSSSQLKKARRWNTMINQLRVPTADGSGTFNPAMFYRSYLLTTVPEKNDRGSWFGWKVMPDENVLEMEGGEDLYIAARDFRKQIQAGAVQAAAPREQDPDQVRDDKAPM